MRQVLALSCLLLLAGACGPRRPVESRAPGDAGPRPSTDPVRVLRFSVPAPCGSGRGPDAPLEGRVETDGRAVSFVEPEDGPLWPSAPAGRFDVGVMYAPEASRTRTAGGGLRWSRLPRWDREYGLWLEPQARWLADPALRTWIAATVDRERLVRVVFSGEAEVVSGKNAGPGSRPLGGATRPRIELRHAATDPRAQALAAALKADLEARGFTIEIRAGEASGSGAGARLVLLQSETGDAVSDVRVWLDCFGAAAGDARAVLESASRAADAASGEALALHAMEVVRNDARWVPLVRVQAWLAVRDGIEAAAGVEPGRIVVGGVRKGAL